MLNFFGRKDRYCDGLSRRSFLQVGAIGIGGLTLADLFRSEALAANRGSQKGIINIFLGGGPSHMDMFDLKPDAPQEFRGEFNPLDTNVPGVQICEHFPQLAGMMDKLTIIRSLVDSSGEHSGYQCNSGWAERDLRSVGGHPSLGSVAGKLIGSRDGMAPPFVDFSNEGKPGFLGPVFGAYRPDGTGRENLRLNRGLSLDRLGDRANLLSELDRIRDRNNSMQALDAFNQRAVDVLTSNKLADAFDLQKEDPKIVARYGKDSNDRFLLARRLIEAGVRCVSLSWGGWDTHGDNFKSLKRQLPKLDQGLSALVEDLSTRGLYDDVIVVMWGEFGRTPRINSGAGRDHWPRVCSALMGGGGLKTGQVIGATNRLGEYAVERPVHFQEVFATFYHQLGLDPRETRLADPNGRPQFLVDHRTPMPELV